MRSSIGPVTLIDTAGIDDIGELGMLRAEKTWSVLEKVDLAVLVIDATLGIGAPERSVMERLSEMGAGDAGNCGKSGQTGGVPVVAVANKVDLSPLAPIRKWEDTLGTEITEVSSLTGEGTEKVKERIIACACRLGRPVLNRGSCQSRGHCDPCHPLGYPGAKRSFDSTASPDHSRSS